jgi:AraC-like DNA-binding protein/DNA-binding MarR family transcriptional regulator
MNTVRIKDESPDVSVTMLPIVLTRAHWALTDFLKSGLAFQGIRPADFAILEALQHKGPLSRSVIESRVMRSLNTPVRPGVERLRRGGLITIRRDPRDSTMEVLELTDDGHEYIAKIYRAHERDIEAVVGTLSRRQRKELWRSLKTIRLQSERCRRLRSGNRNGGLAPWQLRRVTDYMTRHVADPVRLKELAEETRLSPSQFGRAFKVSMGISPHKWQLNLRIERAQDLLREGASSLAEISLATGFTEQSHFSRVFKEVIGVPPGTWQRQHRF